MAQCAQQSTEAKRRRGPGFISPLGYNSISALSLSRFTLETFNPRVRNGSQSGLPIWPATSCFKYAFSLPLDNHVCRIAAYLPPYEHCFRPAG